MNQLKKVIKSLIPPLCIDLYHLFCKNKYGFIGNYSSWNDAENACLGYDNKLIFETVKKAVEKVKNGEAKFERDSVLFYEEDYNFELLSALFYIALAEHRISLVDFGGSLGSTYNQHKNLLHNVNVNWNIVEQKHFVEYGEKYLKEDGLNFYYNIENCLCHDINCLLLSSSLQYFKSPFNYLNKFKQFDFSYIIIDRTPFYDLCDRIVKQVVPSQIYSATYPAWIFNESKLIQYMSDKYDLIFKWNGFDEMPVYEKNLKTLRYEGMLFKHK